MMTGAPSQVGDRGKRDDRILPLTRAVAAVVIVILAVAWIVLFLTPERTDTRFAWTITPTMTAMLMGAGYGSALWFFARVLTGRRWHEVSLGFLPTSLFTWMMLGATFLHWDRFHHGTFEFRLWFWVYIVTPIVVPGLWLLNRSRDPLTPGTRFPTWMRRAMVAAGGAMLAIAVWMYVLPASAIEIWPWSLTPLTARAVAAFVALPGVAWLVMAWDGRWSAAVVMLQTVAVGLVMLLIAVVRAWNEFDSADPATYVYVAGLGGTLVAIGALGLFMRRLRLRAGAPRGARPRAGRGTGAGSP
jgi:hypothetical protein